MGEGEREGRRASVKGLKNLRVLCILKQQSSMFLAPGTSFHGRQFFKRVRWEGMVLG